MTKGKPGKKRILVTPLNWGLGHATRLIPVINSIYQSGNEVLLGGSPTHKQLLLNEFPDLKIIETPYLGIKLTSGQSHILKLASQLVHIAFTIYKEHTFLKKLVKSEKIDAVISDNCYGLWNSKITSVFISHQLNIKLPKSIHLLENTINKINHFFIRKFTICWIPDLPDIPHEDYHVSDQIRLLQH